MMPSPWSLWFIYTCFIKDLNKLLQQEGKQQQVFKVKQQFCMRIALSVNTFTVRHNYDVKWSNLIRWTAGWSTNFIVSVWAQTWRSSLFSYSVISQPLKIKAGQYYWELMRKCLKGPKFNFSVALSLAFLLSDLKVPFVSCVNGTTTRGVYWVAMKFRFATYM